MQKYIFVSNTSYTQPTYKHVINIYRDTHIEIIVFALGELIYTHHVNNFSNY